MARPRKAGLDYFPFDVDFWDDYKIIWYVAKEVGSQYLWHVNGILVEKDKTPEHIWEEIKDDVDDDMDISDDEGAENVEIDIHKQEHKDWNEIKTSIHVRADVENHAVRQQCNPPRPLLLYHPRRQTVHIQRDAQHYSPCFIKDAYKPVNVIDV